MSGQINVAVLMGGMSPEREISIESGRVALRHLHGAVHRVRPIVISPDGAFRVGKVIESSADLDQFDIDKGLPPTSPLLECVSAPIDAVARLANDGTDVAFLALHGAGGEDGSIQGLFEWAGIPYTFSGVSASVLALDKCAFKALIVQHGLPTAKHLSFTAHDWHEASDAVLSRAIREIGFPMVIKAGTLGSSFGVSIAKDQSAAAAAFAEAAKLSNRLLVEAYIRGVELTCPVVGDARGHQLQALPLVEIVLKHGEFFDTESKYAQGGAEEICPARVSQDVARRMAELSKTVHVLVGCDGISRTDAILAADGTLWLLETNTIPGLTAASLLPKSAMANGLSLADLFARVVALAVGRSMTYRRSPTKR